MGKPQRLTPSLREKVWGRTSLAPWFPDAKEPIGEAWYLADHELPLLVKLIFTSERLSVQVHPDDGEGVPRGKTEMWHILDAEPGATIALGFREPITRERLVESTRTGEIEQLLNWLPVKRGETYFTPAHTVHAIGGGIVLCEIQQWSDVTYRLWDYGRPREIHVAQAAAVSDLGVHPGAAHPVTISEGRELLVRSKHFVTEAVRLRAGEEHEPAPETCQLWICLEGQGTIAGQAVRPGEVWLMPEAGEPAVMRGATQMRFLRTYVPRVEQTV
jgi:mannose-6-phosphate isomerase